MRNVRTLPTEWGVTVVRIMAGVILMVAAFEKFNAGGFEGFTKVVAGFGGVPAPQFWGVFIPLLELIGGALLILGLGARLVAALFVCEFLVTSMVLKVPRQPPFGGWDSMRIDLMLLALAVAVLLVGPGALTLESALRRYSGSQRPTAQPHPVPAGER